MSPVIATVLLLVITVVLVSVLAAFVIPFVRNSVEPSGECFKALNKLTLIGTEYSCYVAGTNGRTGISVQTGDVELDGFTLVVYAQGSSVPIEVVPGATSAQVRVLGSAFNTPLELPAKGGLRTYVVNGPYNQVEIVPILRSGKCDKTSSIKIVECSDPSIITGLTQY